MFVAFLPIIIEVWENINGKTFEWRPIYRWWIGMIPLILMFLINNYFLMPRLLKKARVSLYLFSIGILLIAFVIYQHSMMPEFIKPPEKFPPPIEYRTDFPPPFGGFPGGFPGGGMPPQGGGPTLNVQKLIPFHSFTYAMSMQL